ncbi:nicotinate-nucleotide--dimethylbenzimidazole phosphoribosyltransferase [Shewanella sp. D64]|uniref:nicotinate-nucleotide--dimethylbenzimidazole phosphoribosyltransferase n=1 Tax=unclassified Shewanella TaxID=196818 RepID=UPI0022BA5DB5|nr:MULTISPECIES: nicotinate-nucleotide--dimethylbenzimidazole phosphoribosyltransferase [unclassified Shewanella]MEC4724947.1 nicotinate-nucleotide--dimethylbenzimidazole phosphoribosyltransferase [Shewanella sp. D64]MEC4736848.1 nicotinate-nucleotide--dimethylbenzimidazole phosphoribosyltransferase [Shewanella sp. E94]WBJ96447.1 nicotinate-nucleotide--dimethylbenzimidazole phosphoribosyltransferase [Shewanella sp. MTB7]
MFAVGFDIAQVSREFDDEIQNKIDNKTKPLGALGELENLAKQIARVLGKDKPQIVNPKLLIFAADHGIAAFGVSIAPSEVTAQMVMNFINGGAAINVFCRQVGFELEVIDCGILQPLEGVEGIIKQRLGAGTAAIHLQAAMSLEEVKQGFEMVRARVEHHHQQGCNLIALGEMGIGNTSSAAAIMATIMEMESIDCVGRGTGVDTETLQRKQMLVEQALRRHEPELTDPYNILACLGGFEIVQMTGAMLAAAERKMLVVIDGFIATAAALVAVKINPNVRDYMIFGHQSDERGHCLMMEHLHARPLLKLDMRLGEGTGAALSLPLIQAAAAFYNEMASFNDAGIEI